MVNAKEFSELFLPEPSQWGLRGDPHVWRAMHASLAGVPVPDSVDEVREVLRSAFRSVVGVDLFTVEDEQVHRPDLDHGGMSGGWVSLWTWRDRLIIELEHRAAGGGL